MSIDLRRTAFAVIATVLMCGTAQALPANVGRGLGSGLPIAKSLADGQFVAPPRAFIAFCETYSSQCNTAGGSRLPALDADLWEELNAVNALVNGRIQSASDPQGTDVWTIAATEGDCDDYAVEKRRQLLSLGWPSSALSLTVAYIRSGQAHLVLTVRTDRGDFVLDNLRKRVVPAVQTGYRFVARQSAVHPRLWVRIDGVAHDSIATAKARPSNKRPVEETAKLAEPPASDVAAAAGPEAGAGENTATDVRPTGTVPPALTLPSLDGFFLASDSTTV